MKPLKIACLGDSLTEGSVSYDWVKQMNEELEGHAVFHNFGVNGELAYNALQRVDAVIAKQPDIVLILLGTNDAIAASSEPNTNRYVKDKGLPQRPDEAWFIENLSAIITQLKDNLASKIILITLPPFGDDLTHRSNKIVFAYNEVIRAIAKQFELAVLDLGAEMKDFLIANAGENPVPFRTDMRIMNITIARLPQVVEDWNAIAEKNGLLMTSDTIHLNARSGRMLMELIKKELLGE